MNKLIAIVSFALSLYGCDVGGNTSVQQRSVDGEAVLHSRVVARPGVARFECLRSASGHCHFTIHDRDCGGATGAASGEACAGSAVERFALASGHSRRLVKFRDFDSCVSTGIDSRIRACDASDLLATR